MQYFVLNPFSFYLCFSLIASQIVNNWHTGGYAAARHLHAVLKKKIKLAKDLIK